jgi:calcium-dependent protein kinase
MIDIDPSKRITALQALDHVWIKQAGGDQPARVDSEEQAKLDKEVVANLKKYRGQSILKRAAMNVLVKQLAPSQINTLKKEFEKMDKDLSGFIEIKELEQAIQQADLDFTAAEIKEIIN